MAFEVEMLMNIFKFEKEFKMNKLGMIHVDTKEIVDIGMGVYENGLCFGRCNENSWLSRGSRYYTLCLTIDILKRIHEALDLAIERKYRASIYTLNEFLLSQISSYWYNLQYGTKNRSYDMAQIVFQQMKIMAGNIISVIAGSGEYCSIDWTYLSFIIENVKMTGSSFRVPECDNKNDVVKESCWLLQSNILNEIDAIMYPMYGSLYLMLFNCVILERNYKDILCYPVNVGFHDKLDKEPQESFDFNLSERSILVLDDNIGAGNTIGWCRRLIEQQNCRCITRVCEIPWDVLERIGKYDVVSENLDIPSIKSNFRILYKNSFIRQMMSGEYEKIYYSKHLYVNEEKELELMHKRMNKLRESNQFLESQLDSMSDELTFYENTLRMWENNV